jgi:hypothetical protein
MGTVLAVLLTLGMIGDGYRIRGQRDQAAAANAAEQRGEQLTDEQRDARDEWRDRLKNL